MVLAAFAVFVFLYGDDLSDDAAYTPSEMLKESSERLSAHRKQQAVYSWLFPVRALAYIVPTLTVRLGSGVYSLGAPRQLEFGLRLTCPVRGLPG